MESEFLIIEPSTRSNGCSSSSPECSPNHLIYDVRMIRQRGKAVITKIKAIKGTTSPSHDVLKPIVLLSLLVGYIPKRWQVPGAFGGLLWLVSLLLHSAFDFMSARKLYGYAWAFIQIMLFVNLAVCTYSVRSKAVPWLEMSVLLLDNENKYIKTFARIRKLFRAIPWVVISFSFLATGLQFFCFQYDGAFSVSFEQQVSSGWRITLLVVWFLTNVHILYAFAFFWCVTMCNMYTTGYSMTEYHDMMTAHLKNKDTPVTFRQAVHSFAERGQFLKKSASACRIPLTSLLVYSIASLAVNAFYYLYKTRKAAYIFFALMPLICSVYPLCLAAWVTKQYKWYLAVVVKAWAERPESSDEDDDSGSDQPRPHKSSKHKSFARKFTKRVKSAGKKDSVDDNKITQSSQFFGPTRSKRVAGGSYSDTDVYPEKKVNFADSPRTKKKANKTKFTSFSDNEVLSDDEDRPRRTNEHKPSIGRLNDEDKPSIGRLNDGYTPSIGKLNGTTVNNKLNPLETRRPMSEDDVLTDDGNKSNADDGKEGKPKPSRQRVMELILRGTARVVGRLRHRAKLPKFNFEKYISYLQNVLPTVGFDIMGITVTWEMVSTLLFLEVSLLSLFMQESIFGNQKANVSL